MKYMITAALALCLLGGAAAAQDRDHDRGGGRGPEGHQDRGQGGEHRGGPGPQGGFQRGPEQRGQAFQRGPEPHGGGPQGGFQRGQGPGFQGQGYQRGPDQRGGGFQRGPERRDEFRGGGPRGGFDHGPDRFRGPEPGYRGGGWLHDQGWRGGGRFHVPFYRYPVGWGYRRWAFGMFLPGVFLAPDYTIWQYWLYGLPAPPPGYHWIRVGPDALLVRYGDGYVLDAAYGIFY